MSGDAKENKIITIDKISGNFYGGLPFIANWSFNDGSTPSTLNISVVNAGGSYSITDKDISYTDLQTVSLGNFTFNGFLTGYDIEESAQQKILHLEYVDQSILLEAVSIGLCGRHGYCGTDQNGTNTTSGPKNMILVGRQYGPCDSNLDSTQLFNNQTAGQPDPCDPCPNMPENGYQNACQDDPNHLKILPIYYTFNELLNSTSQWPLTVDSSGITNQSNNNGLTQSAINNHRAQHVGTLKSVLSTWCQELGLSYYFDPIKQKLYIISRANPIDIPSQTQFEKESNIVSLKYGRTKSKTFSRGFIAYVGTQGKVKDYECKREDVIMLRCLRLEDLYTTVSGSNSSSSNSSSSNSSSSNSSSSNSSSSSGGSGSINSGNNSGYDSSSPASIELDSPVGLRLLDDVSALVYSTVLAYYPSQVRLSFLWFKVLGIYDHSSAEQWKVNYTTPSASDGSTASNGGPIYEWGNMNIVEVISAQNDATISTFQTLKNLLPKDYTDYVNADDLKSGGTYTPDKPSYYFIVATWDKDLADRQEQRDQVRAKQFLGRYFYRTYDKMAVGGGSNENTQLSIDAAGASATFHPRGENITSLPIFSFGHTSKSTIGKIVQSLGQDDADNTSSIGSPPTDSPTQSNKLRTLKSLLLVDRGDAAKFKPHESEFSDWKDTWGWYENICPAMIGNNGRPDKFVEMYPDASLRLFVVRSVSEDVYKVKVKAGQPNPWEPTIPKTRMQSIEGIDGTNSSRNYPADNDPLKNASYGLMAPNTIQITMPGGLDIFPPAQSIIVSEPDSGSNMSFNSDSSNTTVGSNAGFRVFVKSDSKYQKIIPKFQKIAYKEAAPKDVSKVDYIYKELQNDNLEAFMGKKQCMPEDDEIKSYVSKFAPFMAITNNNVSSRASVKVLGLMTLDTTKGYGVGNGLSSVQISLGDNGVFTDYSFEDKIVTPPSDDVMQNEIIRQNKIHATFGENLQKLTSQQYSDIKQTNSVINNFNTNTINL